MSQNVLISMETGGASGYKVLNFQGAIKEVDILLGKKWEDDPEVNLICYYYHICFY